MEGVVKGKLHVPLLKSAKRQKGPLGQSVPTYFVADRSCRPYSWRYKMYQLQHYILSEHEILLTKHNNINNQYLLSSGAGSNTFIPATIISALDEK